MQGLDGVMLGRAAYHTPWLLADVDRAFFQKVNPLANRIDAVTGMFPYIEEQMQRGEFLSKMARHMLGLFHGQPGGRHWRQIISEQSHLPGAGIDVLRRGLEAIETQSNRLIAAE
jgi:tRNA-dihydrouridine synthase A